MALAAAAWLLTLAPEFGPTGWVRPHAALTIATVTAALLTLLAASLSDEDRWAWGLLGLGLAGYAAGFVIQFYLPSWQHHSSMGIKPVG